MQTGDDALLIFQNYKQLSPVLYHFRFLKKKEAGIGINIDSIYHVFWVASHRV